MFKIIITPYEEGYKATLEYECYGNTPLGALQEVEAVLGNLTLYDIAKLPNIHHIELQGHMLTFYQTTEGNYSIDLSMRNESYQELIAHFYQYFTK